MMDIQPESAEHEPSGVDSAPIDAVIFFWRPGCGFCAMLRRKLAKAGVPLHEINIWDDPRAAQAVRTITGGSETVPTVVIGETAMVNPSARKVVAAVGELAPHLLSA